MDHLHNLRAQYSIYYNMNHSKVVYMVNHTALDLSHQKFAYNTTSHVTFNPKPMHKNI